MLPFVITCGLTCFYLRAIALYPVRLNTYTIGANKAEGRREEVRLPGGNDNCLGRHEITCAKTRKLSCIIGY